MSITIGECLNLPSLKRAKVVSGHNGLNKIVDSVTVLEFIELDPLPRGEIFTPNEIIISAFYSIRNDIQAQLYTIDLLYSSGGVGLVLYYVGYCLPKIDRKLIDRSNELGFPIIAMPSNPTNLLYSEVIVDILGAVFRDRIHETNFTNKLLDRVSQFPEHQRTLTNTLQLLGERIRCSVFIVNTASTCLNHYIMASSSITFDDTVVQGFLTEYIDSNTAEKTITSNDERITVYKVPFFAEGLEQLSLIVVDEFGSTNMNELSSAVEFLQIFSSVWKQPLDEIQPEVLITALLGGDIGRAERIAGTLNIDLGNITTMLVIRPENPTSSLDSRLNINRKLLAALRKEARRTGNMLVSDIYNNAMIVALLDLPSDANTNNDYIYELREALKTAYSGISIAVINNIAAGINLQRAFMSYCENIDAAKLLFPTRDIYLYADLRFAAECSQIAGESGDQLKYYYDMLSTLRFQKDGEELVKTLEVYLLDANSNTKAAAEALFLHRNTIQYRINKIRRLLDFDFDASNPTGFYTLYKAVAINRLAGAYERISK